MTRAVSRLAAVAGLMFAFSCGNPNVLTLGQTYTLQGIIADAVTGARLGGSDLHLYLVQGSEVRGPTRLISSGDLMGEYAFTGIPVQFATGNNVWKVVVIKNGYQRFESEVTFKATTDGTATGGSVNVIVDPAFSKIGNVFLFPNGVTAPDYTFVTMYNGKPVPGAVVQLDPITASNTPAFNTTSGDTLPANTGYVPSVVSTATDANGHTTITGANLAVGAMYQIQVLPVSFKETATSTAIQLGYTSFPTTSGSNFVKAGMSGAATLFTVVLFDMTPATTSEPICITSMSNDALDSLQPNGTLAMTFSLPVTVQNPNNFGAALTAGTKADGTTAGTGALNTTQEVASSLSSDGLTLTLAPNYTGGGGQAPGATDRGVSVTYSDVGPAAPSPGGGLIIPKDYPAKAFNPFTLTRCDTGAAPTSFKVQITGP